MPEVRAASGERLASLFPLVKMTTDFCRNEGLGKMLNLVHDLDDHLSSLWSQRLS